jgi:hypothetical protein
MGFGFVIYYLFNYSDEILKLITPFKVIGLAFLYSFLLLRDISFWLQLFFNHPLFSKLRLIPLT